jgi:hypothetical protein
MSGLIALIVVFGFIWLAVKYGDDDWYGHT